MAKTDRQTDRRYQIKISSPPFDRNSHAKTPFKKERKKIKSILKETNFCFASFTEKNF